MAVVRACTVERPKTRRSGVLQVPGVVIREIVVSLQENDWPGTGSCFGVRQFNHVDFVGRKSDEEIHCVKCNISMSHEECTPAVMLPEYTNVQIQICENVVPKIENQN